jgi:hypothetical protein
MAREFGRDGATITFKTAELSGRPCSRPGRPAHRQMSAGLRPSTTSAGIDQARPHAQHSGVMRGLVVIWLVVAGAQQAAPAAEVAAAGSPLAHGRQQMKALTDSVQRIERLGMEARGRYVRSSCVAERLAEAKAGVQIASGEIAKIEVSLRRPDADQKAEEENRAYAVTRLDMLAERAKEVERAARACNDDDRSAIDITRVEVEVSPPGQASGGVVGGGATAAANARSSADPTRP